MAYVTPGTVAAGDVATAAAWNVVVGDIVDHETRITTVSNAIGVQAAKNATQAIPAASIQFITFPIEDWDSSSFHSTATNTSRITIPTGLGGKYLVIGKASFASGTTPGATTIYLYVNGNPDKVIAKSSVANDSGLQGSITIVLAAGDYIELGILCAVASTLQSSGVDYSPCYFSAVRIGS